MMFQQNYLIVPRLSSMSVRTRVCPVLPMATSSCDDPVRPHVLSQLRGAGAGPRAGMSSLHGPVISSTSPCQAAHTAGGRVRQEAMSDTATGRSRASSGQRSTGTLYSTTANFPNLKL